MSRLTSNVSLGKEKKYFSCVYCVSVVGPIITEGPTSKETIRGNNVIFRCMVDGNPRPTVQWEKDGIALPISGGLSVSAGGQLLSVYAVQLLDAGNYTCVAEDVVTGQKVRAFAYLDVYGK